jgi:hypothetical protein
LKENGKPVSLVDAKYSKVVLRFSRQPFFTHGLSYKLSVMLVQRPFAAAEAHSAGVDAFDFYRG